MKDITIVRYESLRECVAEVLGREIDDDDIRHGYWIGHNGRRPYRIKLQKFLSSDPGCWGWAEYRTKTIHLFVSARCTREELVSALAHEAAHLRRPRHKDKREEERKAARVALDARFAYEAMQTILQSASQGGR